MEPSLAELFDRLALAEARQIAAWCRVLELEDSMNILKGQWSAACEAHRDARSEVAALLSETREAVMAPLVKDAS